VRRTDVQRSVRRWLWFALADDAWSLEDERIEVADDARPAGYVEASTPVSVEFARVAVPQGDTRKRTTITATLYPVTDGSAQDCGQRARELVDALEQAFTIGLVLPGDPEVPLYPAVLPLWDFAGVPADATVAGAPLSYADVDSVTVREIADPLDDRRWTVVFEARMSWWSAGRGRIGTAEEPPVGSFGMGAPPVIAP
jgi:hypothetical protein